MIVLTVEEMKNLETKTMIDDKITSLELMERAGIQVFNEIVRFIGYYDKEIKNIIVLAGVGNNGGDGLVAARKLVEGGYSITTVIIGNPKAMTPETKMNYDALNNITRNINIMEDLKVDEYKKLIQNNPIVIDAIFGVGLNRDVSGIYKVAIDCLLQSQSKVISIDIPSGIKGDNGKKLGVAVKSHKTVIIHSYKSGNLLNDAKDHHGCNVLVDIGLMNGDYYNKSLLAWENVQHLLKKRKNNTHKYHYGNVLTIGGSSGMTGAALMCAFATLRVGTGVTSIAINEKYFNEMTNIYPEIMIKSYKNINDLIDILHKKDAIAFGPGLGRKDYNFNILEHLLETDIPLIIDADGIYYLKYFLKNIPIKNKIIITPHIGEMAMLLDKTTGEIEEDPIFFVNKLTMEYGLTVVLKGTCTIIGKGDKMFFSTFGNPGMATAGSGDVLTGIITGMVGQGLNNLDACLLGVYLHGNAGDIAAKNFGELPMMATDIIKELPRVFKFWNL